MKAFRVLLLALIFSVQESEEYKIIITRQPRDKFTIPSFLCTSKWRDKCKDMGGKNTGTTCTCKCKEGNNNVFGYFENAWKCISNHNLRHNFSGCSYELFHSENKTSRLKVVALNKVVLGSYGYLGSLSKYCKLESQISYLNCDGKWKQFKEGSTSVGFSFRGYDRNLYYWDKKQFRKYWPIINGRVINLSLRCSARRNGEKQGRHCVLLKVKGHQNCNFTSPTISTSTTSSTTAKLSQTSPSTSSTTSSTTASKLGQTSSITSSTSQTTSSSSFNKQKTLGQTSPSTSSTTSSATSSTTASKLGQTSSITSSTSQTTSSSSFNKQTTLGQTSQSASSTTSSTTASSSFNKQTITIKLAGISSITSSTTSSMSSNEQTTPTDTAGTKITTGTLMKTSSYELTTASYPIIDISSPTGRVTKTTKSQTSDGIPSSPQEEERANTSASSSGSIIGGTVVGVIALVVIILIGVIKRKKRFSQAKRESTVAENPSYDYAIPMSPGRLQFPHNEYSYAYADNHPVAVKEKNGRVLGSRVANVHNGNIEGVTGSPPNHSAPIYSTLEEPNYAKPNKPPRNRNVVSQGTQRATKQEPVYDVLEDPNSTLNTSPNTDGPTYDTLEDPNYAKSLKNTRDVLSQKNEGTKTEDVPVYEGHKDPNSIGAPVHSVLQGPNSNEQQVNDALEDNDPHIYGSLDSPDPHLYGALYYPTTNVASGYNNVLYGSINDTITLDTRQLGQLGLDSSETGFSKNVMAMKNMSGVN